jgi:hypothetical protein
MDKGIIERIVEIRVEQARQGLRLSELSKKARIGSPANISRILNADRSKDHYAKAKPYLTDSLLSSLEKAVGIKRPKQAKEAEKE